MRKALVISVLSDWRQSLSIFLFCQKRYQVIMQMILMQTLTETNSLHKSRTDLHFFWNKACYIITDEHRINQTGDYSSRQSTFEIELSFWSMRFIFSYNL